MRVLLLAFGLLFGLQGFSQVMQVDRVYGRQGNRFAADSAFQLPRVTGTIRNSGDTGLLRYNKADSTVYVYTGSGWVALAGGGGGTNFWTLGSQGIFNNQIGGVGIGATPDSTYELDVLGDIRLGQNQGNSVVMGNGLLFDTSSTMARLFESSKAIRIQSNKSTGERLYMGTIGGNSGDTTTEAVISMGSISATAGIKNGLNITGRSLHSSGSADMNLLKITPQLQQSGTPTGKVRGLYIDRDSVSQTTDFMAIETTGGDVRFAGLPVSGDTTPIKPVGYNSSGDLVAFNYWPGGGGGGGITTGQLTDSLDIIRDSIAAVSGRIPAVTNFANTDLTFTGDRFHSANNKIFEINGFKAFNLSNNNGDTYLTADSSLWDMKTYHPGTNQLSGLVFGSVGARVSTAVVGGKTGQLLQGIDSSYLERENGTHTFRSILGEDKFLYRKATIAGTVAKELIMPVTGGNTRDTVATLADVRAGGGSGLGRGDSTGVAGFVTRKALADTSAAQSGAVFLISDFNTTNTTATNTGLKFTAQANQSYRIVITGTVAKAVSTTGLKVAVNAPSGATIKGVEYRGQAVASTALQNSLITSIGTLGATFATGAGVEVPFRIEALVTLAGTAGEVELQAATVTSNTATVYAGTTLMYQRARGL